VLPRCLQDVCTYNVIITCKTCEHAATMRLNSTALCAYPLTSTVGRGCDPTGATGQGALRAPQVIICYL
jgi:hypothetical protein